MGKGGTKGEALTLPPFLVDAQTTLNDPILLLQFNEAYEEAFGQPCPTCGGKFQSNFDRLKQKDMTNEMRYVMKKDKSISTFHYGEINNHSIQKRGEGFIKAALFSIPELAQHFEKLPEDWRVEVGLDKKQEKTAINATETYPEGNATEETTEIAEAPKAQKKTGKKKKS